LRRAAVDALGDALTGPGVLASEDDYQLAHEAAAFGLKAFEALHRESPENRNILAALASGFTQYGYAFVQQEADRLEATSVAAAREERDRAKRLFLRARAYGLRGLELRVPAFAEALRKSPADALKNATAEDVPLLYWTGAAWAASVTADKSDLAAVGDLPLVEAMMKRALELDEAWGKGSIHEFFVSYDAGRPEAMGGSAARAKEHMDRALALCDGKKVGVYVTWAESVCVRDQDRKCFDENLGRALAFDLESAPDFKLANVIAQRRARWLQGRVQDLFISDEEEE
jgi:predicted anti-sigma-YlaC factor YlaD